MADLTRIDILIQTSSYEDAGTDGSVYLASVGVSFAVTPEQTTSSADLAVNTHLAMAQMCTTGKRMTRESPIFMVEDADRFPVYVRFEQGISSHWHLQRATVHLNESTFQQYESRTGIDGLWFGKNSGAFHYLDKHSP